MSWFRMNDAEYSIANQHLGEEQTKRQEDLRQYCYVAATQYFSREPNSPPLAPEKVLHVAAMLYEFIALNIIPDLPAVSDNVSPFKVVEGDKPA
jgi:hypothetical protein